MADLDAFDNFVGHKILYELVVSYTNYQNIGIGDCKYN